MRHKTTGDNKVCTECDFLLLKLQNSQVEPQCDFYSGHRHFHFLISQIIIDNWNNTRFIQTGFLGNLFDSMTYRLMTPVGPGRPLDLPFRQQRIRQMRARTKRRARRLNQTTKPSPRFNRAHYKTQSSRISVASSARVPTYCSWTVHISCTALHWAFSQRLYLILQGC